MGTGAPFRGLKQPVCKADHSPPPSAENENVPEFCTLPFCHMTSWQGASFSTGMTVPLPSPFLVTEIRNLILGQEEVILAHCQIILRIFLTDFFHIRFSSSLETSLR